VLSKLLLLILLALAASKFGLVLRLRQLKPRLDRAVNITIVVVVVAYAGQLLWLLTRGSTP
jgi:hypothetical protein